MEEAFKKPVTPRLETKVEEAAEIRPPVKVERLVTFKVEPSVAAPPIATELEAERAPVTFKLLAKVEELKACRPP